MPWQKQILSSSPEYKIIFAGNLNIPLVTEAQSARDVNAKLLFTIVKNVFFSNGPIWEQTDSPSLLDEVDVCTNLLQDTGWRRQKRRTRTKAIRYKSVIELLCAESNGQSWQIQFDHLEWFPTAETTPPPQFHPPFPQLISQSIKFTLEFCSICAGKFRLFYVAAVFICKLIRKHLQSYHSVTSLSENQNLILCRIDVRKRRETLLILIEEIVRE